MARPGFSLAALVSLLLVCTSCTDPAENALHEMLLHLEEQDSLLKDDRGNVTDLNLSYMDLADKQWQSVGELQHLDVIYLEHLTIGGELIGDHHLGVLVELPALRAIDLDGTAITDAAMDHLVKLRALKNLSIAHTAIGDDAIARMAQKDPGIEQLWVDRTRVSDASIPVFTGMESLFMLKLNDSRITPDGVAALRAARPGMVIYDK